MKRSCKAAFAMAVVLCAGVPSLHASAQGHAWAWGYNSSGQLGDGTTGGASNTPAQVSGLSGVTSIAGGFYHSLALRDDGTVWACGYNYDGALEAKPKSQFYSNRPEIYQVKNDQ